MKANIDPHVILRRLKRRKIRGGKHLPEHRVLSWIKPLNRGEQNVARSAYEECVKNGIIRRFPHTGEMHVSINPKRLEDVYKLLGES